MLLRKLSIHALLLVATTTAQAAIFLSDTMSKETEKKTGINQLSYEQKLALEKWLNDNFELKSMEASLRSHAPIYLSENSGNGTSLELSDGSVWEVAPKDRMKASYWIVPFPLRIIENVDPSDKEEYPKVIVNENTGVRVKVKMTTSPNQESE